MSLPPGFLDELRSRASLAQVVGRKVQWDMRKSNQGKGDMWAPCPFHHEKTASFHVDDRKGFYYCFGCHAKGDAISFVRESENLGFMEAVEVLARETGMTMPARDPRAQEKADRRASLADVMEQAVQFYRLQLKTGAAAAARDYLERRGLDADQIARFEIGFAPEARQTVLTHLTGKGIPAEQVIDAGLAARPDDGGAPYDRFRGRILFPIRDGRGRAIAFGGRAMDPNARAKYLNSPETPLFDKGRSLYNLGPAREAVGKGAALIVAEGYMDVIALVGAGFAGAVAPLGTAITEDQLAMLWRVSDEPVIALDGDTAGLRAAYRLIDLALPFLQAGHSLRFAMMPAGKDPDDLIVAGGAPAVQAVLDQALPMVDLLWRRETEDKNFDSPERRAALDKVLRERLSTIRDPSVRQHYGQAIRDRRWQLFSARPKHGGRGYRSGRGEAPVRPTTKSSVLAAAPPETATRSLREAVILAALIATPEALDDFEHQVEDLDLSDPAHRDLRDALLRAAHAGGELRGQIEAVLGPGTVDRLMSHPHVAICPAVRRPGDAETARLTLAEAFAKLEAERGLDAEIAEAIEDMAGVPDEAVTWRLGQAAQAHQQALRSSEGDQTDFEIGPNGARISRDEKKGLDELLKGIAFDKPRR